MENWEIEAEAHRMMGAEKMKKNLAAISAGAVFIGLSVGVALQESTSKGETLAEKAAIEAGQAGMRQLELMVEMRTPKLGTPLTRKEGVIVKDGSYSEQTDQYTEDYFSITSAQGDLFDDRLYSDGVQVKNENNTPQPPQEIPRVMTEIVAPSVASVTPEKRESLHRYLDQLERQYVPINGSGLDSREEKFAFVRWVIERHINTRVARRGFDLSTNLQASLAELSDPEVKKEHTLIGSFATFDVPLEAFICPEHFNQVGSDEEKQDKPTKADVRSHTIHQAQVAARLLEELRKKDPKKYGQLYIVPEYEFAHDESGGVDSIDEHWLKYVLSADGRRAYYKGVSERITVDQHPMEAFGFLDKLTKRNILDEHLLRDFLGQLTKMNP